MGLYVCFPENVLIYALLSVRGKHILRLVYFSQGIYGGSRISRKIIIIAFEATQVEEKDFRFGCSQIVRNSGRLGHKGSRLAPQLVVFYITIICALEV